MRFIIFTILFAFLALGCSNQPTFNIPPIQIDHSELSKYWKPKQEITSKNTKLIAGKGMGCKAIYIEESNKVSPDYIDIKYTIDSKGKQRDSEIVASSGKINLDAVNWAFIFGLSPTYNFVAAIKNDTLAPIASIKRLYFISDDPLCKGKPLDTTFYSNQTIYVTQ